MKLTRRKFLTTTALAPAIGVFSPAIASGKHHWKMILTWQKLLPGLGTGAVRLAKRIEKLSEGKIKIDVYGGGELVPPLGVFDAVSSGVAQMGHTAPYYWVNKSKACSFFCAVPGGLTAQELNGWIYFGGGKELWDELYGQFNLISFQAGNTGCQMGGWFNKKVNSLSDIKGLKMRIPGLGGEVFTKLGGSSQTISPQELFTAMQSGVIDALEWVGPWNDLALGFHNVAKYYYGPAVHEAGASLELMINRNAYESLSDDLKKIIKIACATETNIMLSQFHANNIRSLNILQKKYNVEILQFPEEVLKAFFKKSNQVVKSIADEGKIERKIFESYQNYRKQTIEYAKYTELAFLKNRF